MQLSYQYDTPLQYFLRAEALEDVISLREKIFQLSDGISNDEFFRRKSAGEKLVEEIGEVQGLIDQKKQESAAYSSMSNFVLSYDRAFTEVFQQDGAPEITAQRQALEELIAVKEYVSPVPDISVA